MLSTDIAMATDTLPGVLYPVVASMIFVAQEQEVVVQTGNQVVPVVQVHHRFFCPLPESHGQVQGAKTAPVRGQN